MSASASPGARVLIIDDDQTATATFSTYLKGRYQVCTAADAASGLLAVETFGPDVIVVDLRMPFISGLGFLYRLRDLPRHRQTPVALVTGDYTIDEAIERELAELGAHVRFKPMWLDELSALITILADPTRRPEVVPTKGARPVVESSSD